MSPAGISYKKLDWILIGCYVLLAVFGWLNIYASTWSEEAEGIFSLASRSGNQLMWIGVAALIAVIVLFLNTRFYRTASWPLYILSTILLAAVLVLGHEVNGSKSWLSLPGGIAIQPSEFSKIATALCLSRVMGSYGFNLTRAADFLKVAAIIIVPVGLIALEPDIGTILVYCSLAFMLYREGLPGRILGFTGYAVLLFLVTLKFSPFVSILMTVGTIGIIRTLTSRTPVRVFLIYAAFIAAAAFIPRLLSVEAVARVTGMAAEYWLLIIIAPFLIWFIVHNVRNKMKGWGIYVLSLVLSLVLVFSVDFIFHNVLQPHHRDRIENLLGISQDLMGAGYNVNQSKIAIGSGGLTGKGFLEGTQTKFNFVPEQSTDFIFCTIGEEWGFIGSITVLALYLIIIMRIVTSAEKQKDRGARVYSYCVASIIFMHVFVNVGMTIGIMPVVGIPLPLISYGGSSFLTFTILLFIHLRFDLERWK